MSDFNVRSDSINVEHIMEQIRARIREKRGVDYSEQEILELASVKLEKFLDPRGVRSEILTQFQQGEPDPNYEFEAETLFETHRGPLRFIRRLLRPFLLLLFNFNKLTYVLHMQADLNARNSRRQALYYELIHNLVMELTKTGIEVKNLKMQTETLASRLEFAERRARALEGAVLYRPTPDDRDDVPVAPSRPTPPPAPAAAPQPPPPAPASGPGPAPDSAGQGEGPGQRSRRRRRRRGRRGGSAPATAVMGAAPSSPDNSPDSSPEGHDTSGPDDQSAGGHAIPTDNDDEQ